MTTISIIALVLLGLGLWSNRSAVLGQPGAAPPQQRPAQYQPIAPTILARVVPPQPPDPTVADLLMIVHHRTEDESLRMANEKAAGDIIRAKANAKASGLPWVILGSPPASPAVDPAPKA